MKGKGLHAAESLANAADIAVALAQGGEPIRSRTAPAKDSSIADERALDGLASTQSTVRGLFIGGTFCYEAQLALSPRHPLAKKEWIEPEDLKSEVLITYPVERSRLDVFRQFLDPAGVEPARLRTAELTAMMIQLVASSRGVACLPNWALHEYLSKDYVVARSLGEEGVWPTLYAAVREGEEASAFIKAFVATAIETCFKTLHGIVTALEEDASEKDR